MRPSSKRLSIFKQCCEKGTHEKGTNRPARNCPAAECPKERIPQCTFLVLGPASAGLFLSQFIWDPRRDKRCASYTGPDTSRRLLDRHSGRSTIETIHEVRLKQFCARFDRWVEQAS